MSTLNEFNDILSLFKHHAKRHFPSSIGSKRLSVLIKVDLMYLEKRII